MTQVTNEPSVTFGDTIARISYLCIRKHAIACLRQNDFFFNFVVGNLRDSFKHAIACLRQFFFNFVVGSLRVFLSTPYRA